MNFKKLFQNKEKRKKILRVGEAIFLLLIVALGGFFSWKKYQTEKNPVSVYEVAVVIRDQISVNPDEDRASSLKRGDAIAVRPENHQWSETEKISYLILKIRMKQKLAEDLLMPEEKMTDKRNEQGEKIKETIVARAYKIDLEKIGFSGDQVISGQPFSDKIFSEDIVMKKNN